MRIFTKHINTRKFNELYDIVQFDKSFLVRPYKIGEPVYGEIHKSTKVKFPMETDNNFFRYNCSDGTWYISFNDKNNPCLLPNPVFVPNINSPKWNFNKDARLQRFKNFNFEALNICNGFNVTKILKTEGEYSSEYYVVEPGYKSKGINKCNNYKNLIPFVTAYSNLSNQWETFFKSCLYTEQNGIYYFSIPMQNDILTDKFVHSAQLHKQISICNNCATSSCLSDIITELKSLEYALRLKNDF